MKRMLTIAWPLLAASTALAGGLWVEVGNPAASPEARKLDATLVARVTSCKDPARSVVTANLVALDGDGLKRTPLRVEALSTPGAFAVSGAAEGVIEITVANPQFGDYRSRTLVRVSPGRIEWASVKRLNAVPPTAADIRAMRD